MKQTGSVFVAIVLVLALVLPAQAKRRELGVISADTPAGWKATITDEGVFFSPRRGGGELNVRIRGLGDDAGPDKRKESAAEIANGNPMTPLGAGYAIAYGEDPVTRAWVLIGGEEYCAFSTDKQMAGLGALIASFGPGSEVDDKAFAQHCIKEAGNAEVLDWLGFKSDPFTKGAPAPGKPAEK